MAPPCRAAAGERAVSCFPILFKRTERKKSRNKHWRKKFRVDDTALRDFHCFFFFFGFFRFICFRDGYLAAPGARHAVGVDIFPVAFRYAGAFTKSFLIYDMAAATFLAALVSGLPLRREFMQNTVGKCAQRCSMQIASRRHLPSLRLINGALARARNATKCWIAQGVG